MEKHGIRLKTHKNVSVVKSYWFDFDDASDMAVGIVLVETADGHFLAYIGVGHDHRGEKRKDHRESDEKYIANWGAPVSRETAESIFGKIDNWLEEV